MKYGIVGSRKFNDYEKLKAVLDSYEDITEIVSGGAKGADGLAKKYAEEKNIPLTEYRPDYKKFGKAAPLKRNTTIIEESDKVIAFWNGKSKGTKDSISKAEERNVPVSVKLI